MILKISYFEQETILFNSFLGRHITPMLFFKQEYSFNIFLYNRVYSINNWLIKFDLITSMHIYRLFIVLFFFLFIYLSLFYKNLNLITIILIIEIFFITLVILLLAAASYWYNPIAVCFALIVLIFSAIEFSILLAITV